jgi:hypothetical protein
MGRRRVAIHTAFGTWLACAAVTPALGQPAAGGIYTCTTPDGRRLTSDRPIPECMTREQRVLNRDGSVRGVYPPSLTADERAEREARDRAAQAEKLQQQDAVRRDRNMMARYPNEGVHHKAREAALDTVRVAMKNSENRIRELAQERKPLESEAEFYAGKTLPPKLKQQLEANEVAIEAQRVAIQNQEAELTRINKLYDAELDRLKKLWSGTPPGTLGPLPAAHAASQPNLTRAATSKAR